LEPRSLVVVIEAEEIFLGESGSSKKRERSRSVSGCRPTPSSVETETFVGDNLEYTATSESGGVGLSLDL
jgi:hypothetical protein